MVKIGSREMTSLGGGGTRSRVARAVNVAPLPAAVVAPVAAVAAAGRRRGGGRRGGRRGITASERERSRINRIRAYTGGIRVKKLSEAAARVLMNAVSGNTKFGQMARSCHNNKGSLIIDVKCTPRKRARKSIYSKHGPVVLSSR